jgi:hypothetical protein
MPPRRALNREVLRRGRVRAYRLYRDLLPVWHAKVLRGDLCLRARTDTVAELTYGRELGQALVAW